MKTFLQTYNICLPVIAPKLILLDIWYSGLQSGWFPTGYPIAMLPESTTPIAEGRIMLMDIDDLIPAPEGYVKLPEFLALVPTAGDRGLRSVLQLSDNSLEKSGVGHDKSL